MNDDKKDDHSLGPKNKMLSSQSSGRTGLTREVQAKIGQQLRAMYNDVVDQGVPDRFRELLSKLDEGGTELSEAAGSGSRTDEDARS